jgi:hypothetical protein
VNLSENSAPNAKPTQKQKSDSAESAETTQYNHCLSSTVHQPNQTLLFHHVPSKLDTTSKFKLTFLVIFFFFSVFFVFYHAPYKKGIIFVSKYIIKIKILLWVWG